MLRINGTSNVGSLSLIFAVFCCIVVNMTVCITDRSVRLIRQKVGGVIYLQRYRTHLLDRRTRAGMSGRRGR